MKKSYLIFITFILLSSCNSIVKTIYDDTTARYNAYFIANEEIKNIEEDYEKNLNQSFDSLIDLTYKIDTNQVSSIQERTQNSIEKLSILIQRQTTSKYVYPSYALIGKSRLLNLNLKEAITTLKYVNSKSNNNEANTMALVYLLRAYTENKDYNSAQEVDKFLTNREMNENLKIEYYKNSYHLFKILNDDEKILSILEKLDRLNLKRDLANKVYFAIGQLYFKKNKINQSKEYFKKCLKNNPNINMGFMAKIFIAKTNDISQEEKTLKEFQKLLRDKKNLNYQDRIYYELAKYYLNNNRFEDAIINFKKAVRKNEIDKEILFNSYLEIAKIFYEEKNDYEQSQKYYDSAIVNINRENRFYDEIKERSETLNELVKNLNIISENDSLIGLTKLSEEEIDMLINNKIKDENKKNKRLSESINNNSTNFEEPSIIKTSSNEGSWYFDNPMIVSSGVSEFQRIWGNRDLVDNWRLISKAQLSSAIKTEVSLEEKSSTTSDNLESTKYDEFYSKIPFDEETQNKLNKDTEMAMSEVGRIYIQKLNEEGKGIEIYEDFIRRFPNSEKKPDIFYQLFLIAENSDYYKNKILDEFSNSIFAKLIKNPNYEIEEFQEYNFLLDTYRELYQKLSKNKNITVINIVDSLSTLYDKNNFFQNILLLKSIAIGKKEGNFSLQYELSYFLDDATDKSAVEYANNLLKSAERVHQEFIYSGLPKFNENIGSRYFFGLIKNDTESPDYYENLDKVLLDMNKKYFRKSFFLIDGIYIDIIAYKNLLDAETLYKKFNESIVDEDIKVNANFVASEKNMNLIFKSKNYREFELFYVK